MSKELTLYQRIALTGVAIAGLMGATIACNETGGDGNYSRPPVPTSVDPCQQGADLCGGHANNDQPKNYNPDLWEEH